MYEGFIGPPTDCKINTLADKGSDTLVFVLAAATNLGQSEPV